MVQLSAVGARSLCLEVSLGAVIGPGGVVDALDSFSGVFLVFKSEGDLSMY